MHYNYNLLVHILLIGDVLNNVGRFKQLLGIRVGDLESKLILHGHNDLNVIQRVQSQVVDEVRFNVELR